MDGKIIIGTEVDTSGIDQGLVKVEKKVKGHDFATSISKGLSKVGDIIKGTLGNIGKVLGTMGTIAKGLIGTIGKVVLTTFGISTALGIIGVIGQILIKAFQKVGEKNQDIIANIKYLIFVLSQALAPAVNSVANFIASSINWILNLLAKVLTYIAYIIKAWFGINILAGASKDAFMQSQKSTEGMANNLGKASKNAKDLKKQLAGFDEMNVLQDNSATSAGAGGGGGGASIGGDITAPTLEFGGEVPEWIKWIADNKDLVISALLGIAGALLVVKLGLTGLLGGVIVGLIIALVYLIIKNWDTIKEVLGKVWSWIDEHIIQPVVALFLWLWNKIVEIFSPIIAFYKPIFETLVSLVMTVVKTIISVLSTIWENIKIVVSNIMTIVKPIFDFIKREIDNKIATFKAFVTIIKNIFSPLMPFFKGIIDFIWGLLKTIGSVAGNIIAGAFKGVVNGILLAIETVLNSPIRAINKLIDVVRVVPGLKNLKTLSTFKLPRLAQGGIINMPGRGVPVGTAIGGERGAEGVIPLTDSQQMALLGEAIGKYININATIPVYVGNRQIARELRKINAEDDFARNS